MRKSLLVFSVVLTLSGCSQKNTLTNMLSNSKNENKSIENNIDFTVEKTTLSKGYNLTEPNVEVVKDSSDSLILANLGILECSDIKVDKITEYNNQVNIYTSIINDKENDSIVVPQILINMKNIPNANLKDLTFNIVRSNYETINLNHSINQSLDTIYNQFNLSPTSIPQTTLTKERDRYYWDIQILNAFKKEDLDSSIVNFSTRVDSFTGKLINTNENNISNIIDKGNILNFTENRFLLYAQKSYINKKAVETLWIYDTETNIKKKIFLTDKSIVKANLNLNLNKVAVIESIDNITSLSVIDLNNLYVKELSSGKHNNTSNIKWHNNDLYAIVNDKNNLSSIISYDINTNKENIIYSSKTKLSTFDLIDNSILFSTFNEDKSLSEVFIYNENEKPLKIDNGTNAKFIDKNKVMYIKENKDISNIYLYNIKEDNKDLLTNQNIINYSFKSKDDIYFIGKNKDNMNFLLLTYNYKNNVISPISNWISNNIYYSPYNNMIYFSITPPESNSGNETIYSININNLHKKD
ncbi:hypothetical protein CLPU_4c02060 [Gottschalkia purinilytica]|uniref:Lipoprotein n=1 Tax=Gottschalkia purinilytica TaxID=1503 RepID=A0A0L0WCL9_GOTPU|nr:lipoprotein [Gottschalkia purinilytica]KNF09160.1 hypothetical protein CLPU_4c02060 [Gottschalkia purinilytica]